MRQKKPDAEMKRNCISLRVEDSLHDLIYKRSWAEHTNCSHWIHELIMEHFRKLGKVA